MNINKDNEIIMNNLWINTRLNDRLRNNDRMNECMLKNKDG
jgi:hypothetical protein